MKYCGMMGYFTMTANERSCDISHVYSFIHTLSGTFLCYVSSFSKKKISASNVKGFRNGDMMPLKWNYW